MREIVFRGKTVLGGAWVCGDLTHTTVDKRPMIRAHGENCARNYMVDPDTVGQYTGMKDKNDMRIFEGDIVRARIEETSAYRGVEWPVMRVVFAEGAFGLMDARGWFTDFPGWSHNVKFKVIGNIHDNPELLEV